MQAPPPTDVPMLQRLGEVRCAPAVRQQLASWDGRLAEALADLPGPDAERRWRIPTTRIGVWLRLSIDPAHEATVHRVSPGEAATATFDPGCAPRIVTRTTGARRHHGFGDSALEQLLARQGSGVIVVWSPHMPLSADAVTALRALTGDAAVELVILLDPFADVEYARRVARERSLPPVSLRPLDSVELIFRGMTTHAPSVQAFRDGLLVGGVLFGYRDADGYRRALAPMLPLPAR